MIVRTLAAAAALALTAGAALAQQTYPIRPIRIVVGFQAGSSSDVAARAVGRKLGEIIKGTIVVENRPGSSGDIAAKYVASAAPDGYTLFLVSVANSISFAAKGDRSVDIARNMTPLAQIGEVPNTLVVTPSLDAKAVGDIIALAKAKPGELSYASSGTGTALLLAAELFSSRSIVQMFQIPYQGSAAAMPDLLAGRTAIMFAPSSTILSFVKENKLRAIATTGVKRSDLMPDVPAVAEQGLPGFESSVWFGVVAPHGLPASIAKALEDGILKASTSPDVKAQFAALGIDVVARDGAAFGAYIRAENAKWTELIKARGLKLN